MAAALPRKGEEMIRCRLVENLAELEAISRDWWALLERSETSEATLTPLWMIAWWRVFGPHRGRALRMVCFYEGGRMVGLAPLLSRTAWHPPGIPFRRLEFLATGEKERDEIGSNYIGLLAEAGLEEEVSCCLAHAVVSGDLGGWDEIVMSRMDGSGAWPDRLVNAFNRHGLDTAVTEGGRVAFIPLPDSWDAYLAALPSKRRRNLKKKEQLFHQWADGQDRFEWLDSPADVERGAGILRSLHAERWKASGTADAFASPCFSSFHQEVLPSLAEREALDLCWISVRGVPIAALYNLVWQGKIRGYLTGRKVGLPAEIRPGIILLARAIRHAIERGFKEYDFGGVDVQHYKREMALGIRPLVDLRVTHLPLREKVRRFARICYDSIHALH